jgi:hypothetical protein
MSNIESLGRNLPKVTVGKQPNAGDIETIAEGMTYRENWPKGNLVFLAGAFRSSLITGCKGQKFGRGSPAGLFKAIIQAAEDTAPLTDKHGKALKAIKSHMTTGVSKATKSRVLVIRALVEPWQAIVPFEFDDEFAPPNRDEFYGAVLKIWQRAGRMTGIGAWRPESGGKFGKYEVAEVS